MRVIEAIEFKKSPINSDVSQLRVNQLKVHEPLMILIDATNLSQAIRLIENVRQHPDVTVSLAPVLFATEQIDDVDIRINYADGFMPIGKFDNTHINEWMTEFEPILQFIAELKNSPDQNINHPARKLLQLIASRNKKLIPSQTAITKSGFIYPILEPLVAQESNELQRLLDFLESEYLVEAEVTNRSHFCQFCHCAFLNFKECCPDCHSDDLTIKELIHHFSCAYVAPLDDFKQAENRLVCPKCDKRLQHIGVDYDKPSTVYNCNQCQLHFQEPDVNTECFNCLKRSTTDDLIYRPVKAYSLTSLGQNAAFYGIDNLFSRLLEEQLTVVEFSTFKHFLELEQRRYARYGKTQSSLAVIRLNNVEAAYKKLGEKANDYIKELANLFVSTFRETDVISVRNATLFCVLLTDTDKKGAQLALERTRKTLEMIKPHSDHKTITINYELQSVDNDTEMMRSIELLTEVSNNV